MPSDRDSDYATAVLGRTEQKQPFVRPGQNDIKDIEERRCTDVCLMYINFLALMYIRHSEVEASSRTAAVDSSNPSSEVSACLRRLPPW